MSEETKIEVRSNEEEQQSRKPFRWRRISFDIFRRTKKDRQNFKNFFGLPLDAEPGLPETGDQFN
jgi:hypothetical protein